MDIIVPDVEFAIDKLSTYIGRGIERSQDLADVVQLIKANRLPRTFSVEPQVSEEFLRIWGELHQPDRKV